MSFVSFDGATFDAAEDCFVKDNESNGHEVEFDDRHNDENEVHDIDDDDDDVDNDDEDDRDNDEDDVIEDDDDND